MSLDNTLLRLGLQRADYNKLAPGLPPRGLEEDTYVMWRAFKDFYDEFPKVDVIDITTFKVWFTEFRHQALPIDRRDMFSALIDTLRKDVPDGMREGLMERMLQSELAVEIMDIVEAYTAGGEVDIDTGVATKLDEYKDRIQRVVKTPEVLDDVDDLMAEDEHDTGIAWRLGELRKSMRPLREGDFGIWAARPDRGKTTGLASEASYWVPQLPVLWPDEPDACIAWCNNEGPGKRIKQRYFQAALGCTLPEMVEYHKDGSLRRRLQDALQDEHLNRLKIFDVHDYYSHEVEALLKLHNVKAVIFDMIDNIKFSGMAANNGQRTDQLLEEMYKWGRNLAVKYKFAGVATSQISGDGDGVPFPPQAALKDSKTGKQGACDFIVMWGAVNDPNMDSVRYLGIPKNKLHRPGGKKNPQCEVVFDAERARLESPGE